MGAVILLVILTLFFSQTWGSVLIGTLPPNTTDFEDFVYEETIKLAMAENQITTQNVSYKSLIGGTCDEAQTIGHTVDLMLIYKAAAIIGPCGNCITAIHSTSYYDKLLISPYCTDTTDEIHSQFITTRPFAGANSDGIANIVKMMLERYDWNIVGIVFDAGKTFIKTKDAIKKFESKALKVETFPLQAYENTNQLLNDIENKARIVILLTGRQSSMDILLESFHRGFHKSHKYQYLTVDFDELYLEGILHHSYLRYAIISGLIDIGTKLSGEINTIPYQKFVENMNATFVKRFGVVELEHEEEDIFDHMNELYEAASYFYDAILVYMKTIEQFITDKQPVNNLEINQFIHNGTVICEQIKNATFEGLSGKIKFNNDGTREPNLQVRNLWNGTTRIIYDGTWKDNQIWWLGGTYEKPKDGPECGFGKTCKETNNLIIIIPVSVCCSLILLLIVIRMYKAQIYENDINNKVSLLNFDDIKLDGILTVRLSVAEVITKKGTKNEATGTIRMRVLHKNKKVMLKKLVNQSVLVSRDVMVELKRLRDLKHKNINRMIGIIKSPLICILQEWCRKGSLYDVLHNEDIQLDWVFKQTFLWDVMNGMTAIHDSPIRLHGHLTSHNCLINHRWIVQISDFGLDEFKKIRNPKEAHIPEDDQMPYEELQWTAPENINFPYKKSRKGDVYSFAIIMSEVINRQGPFEAFEDMRPSEVIHYVKKRCIPPFRPHVTLQTGLDARLVDLMKQCWTERPEERLSFKEIKPILNNIRGEGIDILDNMIEMMERYGRDLHKTAKERTEMYKKEKLKSNELLHRCVPTPVATDLLEGKPIVAETIEETTILVIKIHEFTELLDWLDPQQVVDVLNDFYRMTEQIMSPHKNIYKLLTERETSIYCSSIPGYNNISTTEELASLAVRLSKAKYEFRWRHLGKFKLKLKLTLHLGPTYGVVVGTKIPIYTLFGQTIDYVRALTRYTPANVIVVTAACAKYLQDHDEFSWVHIDGVECQDIGSIKPTFLHGSKSEGVAFEDQEDETEDETEVEVKEEVKEEVKGEIVEPKKRNINKQYWDVGSNVDSLFAQWFQNRNMAPVTEGPPANYSKNPFLKP